MNKTLLSIVVPIYNVKGCLNVGLDSIIKQWNDKVEIIAVDDGSTDGSGKVLDEYAAGLPSEITLKVIHKINQGVCVARNTGLENARGEWVTYMDPDDAYVDGAIAYLIDALEKSTADIINYKERIVHDQKMHVPLVPARVSVFDMNDCKSAKVAVKTIYPIAWNSCYRRKRFGGIKFIPELAQSSEDAVYGFSCLCHAQSVEKHETILYKYYQRANSCVHTASESRIHGYIGSVFYIYNAAVKWKWYKECKTIIFRKAQLQAVGEAIPVMRKFPCEKQKVLWEYFFSKLAPILGSKSMVPLAFLPIYWLVFKVRSGTLATWLLCFPYTGLKYLMKFRIFSRLWKVIR